MNVNWLFGVMEQLMLRFWCDNAIVMMFKNIYLLDIQTEEFIDEMTRSNKNVLFWLVTGTMKKG